MARTLEQIIRQEKPAVVQRAKKQAAKIIAEMDKKPLSVTRVQHPDRQK
ncbi:hypothetical protein ACOIPL_004163 [Vibrio fluvialis]|nr:hypothetical protein [Vibrio fluvialis]